LNTQSTGDGGKRGSLVKPLAGVQLHEYPSQIVGVRKGANQKRMELSEKSV